jgi:D-sedoheptulose 7-phosphate isomerase
MLESRFFTSARMNLATYFEESAKILDLAREAWSEDLITGALRACTAALGGGKPVLVCGNGGSAADAMHLTAELVGRFRLRRQALNVICLSCNPALLTAWANDYTYDTVFSRQVEAYGEPGAVLIGISTSGNSQNVVKAFERARAMSMKTISLTGEGGGKLAGLSDYLFAVPSSSTPLIQQTHICLYHYLCGVIEEKLAECGPTAGNGGTAR